MMHSSHREPRNGNRAEPSAHRFLAECSDKRPSAQYLRPNLQPIYHLGIGRDCGSVRLLLCAWTSVPSITGQSVSRWWMTKEERQGRLNCTVLHAGESMPTCHHQAL